MRPQFATIAAAVAIVLIFGLIFGRNATYAQGDYPKVQIFGSNNGTQTEVATDSTGAPLIDINADFAVGKSYSHIPNTTATAVKGSSARLVAIAVNTPASGTVSIFDLASGSCTGTPSTNTIAVLTVGSTNAPNSVMYNLQASNGLCVKASATMDITVIYQ